MAKPDGLRPQFSATSPAPRDAPDQMAIRSGLPTPQIFCLIQSLQCHEHMINQDRPRGAGQPAKARPRIDSTSIGCPCAKESAPVSETERRILKHLSGVGVVGSPWRKDGLQFRFPPAVDIPAAIFPHDTSPWLQAARPHEPPVWTTPERRLAAVTGSASSDKLATTVLVSRACGKFFLSVRPAGDRPRPQIVPAKNSRTRLEGPLPAPRFFPSGWQNWRRAKITAL